MNAPAQFEVFYDDPLEPLLIASFEEFAVAKAAMERMAVNVPGHYFVWSPGEDEVLAQTDTRSSGCASRSPFGL
jgi:hypothetical protein